MKLSTDSPLKTISLSHRAPAYYAESIRSILGFWGWKCQSYMYFLLGMCQPMKDQQSLAGEDCKSSSKGIYFLDTNPISPFAKGRISILTRDQNVQTISIPSTRNVDPFLKEIDTFGKLGGNFNNLPYSDDEDNDFWFTNKGSEEVAHNYISQLRHPNQRTNSKKKIRKSSKLLQNFES